MGYTTDFKGELLFKNEPTASQLAFMKNIFDEDCRDHPEWAANGLYSVDIEFNDNFTGIRHNGMEKTYDFDKLINLFIRLVKEKYPDFELKGELLAQGEEVGDIWYLRMVNNVAEKHDIASFVGKEVVCPSCHHSFSLSDDD